MRPPIRAARGRRIGGVLFMVDRPVCPHFIEQPQLDDVQSVVLGAGAGRRVGRRRGRVGGGGRGGGGR